MQVMRLVRQSDRQRDIFTYYPCTRWRFYDQLFRCVGYLG